jgi:3-oxoacyl-[acyl-carrier-protein] synthase-3
VELTSAEIERRLAPAYTRLRLPEGRLELMTGIRARHFWEGPVLPSQAAAEAGRKVLAKSGVAAAGIDLLIHCGVCRDRLEPATASNVHRLLGLGGSTQVLDVSNACLGFLNGMLLAAGLIESGQVRRALLVTGEDGLPLLERTLRLMLDPSQTRQSIKPLFANLTIGAGAAACLLCHEDLAPAAPRLLGAVVETDTSHNELCQGGSADGGLEMLTDSEALLEAGLAVANRAWLRFQTELGWTAATPARVICHQVGRVHQRAPSGPGHRRGAGLPDLPLHGQHRLGSRAGHAGCGRGGGRGTPRRRRGPPRHRQRPELHHDGGAMVNAHPGLPATLRAHYPYEPHYLELGPDLRMHYVDEGAGPPVLMLHGNPTWSFMYRRLVQALAPELRCIAPDHIGCGLSDKPQRYPYRLATHVDNVRRLVDALGLERFDLVVHDWGGAIGMGLATVEPSRVRRIVVTNTAAFPSRRIPWRIALCKLPLFGDLAIRGFNAFAGAATFMAVEKPLPPDVRNGFLLPYRNWHDRIANLRFVSRHPPRARPPQPRDTRVHRRPPPVAGRAPDAALLGHARLVLFPALPG